MIYIGGVSMRDITHEMIRIFKIDELEFDFMGYTFKRVDDLNFHHLIVPHSKCSDMRLKGTVLWNGSILKQSTSHEYLHIIEEYDRDMFNAITSEMIDENILRSLEINNLRYIRDILLQFEREHSGTTNKKGMPIIREEYVEDRIKL